MNLIHYRGLNCHLACIISIADSLGVNYRDAFSTLWSETDFTDDSKHHIYVSKRVFTNLKALGIRTEILDCASKKEAEESLSQIPYGEPFVVGMDTFNIPWSPVYQNFHGPHYFFSKRENADIILCFDPTYDESYVRIKSSDMFNYAFDLSRIHRISVEPLRITVSQEAWEILHRHSEIQEELRKKMQVCKNQERENIVFLVKQIDTMINNRYLFERFLHQSSSAFSCDQYFFDKDFFSQWEAVKNGIYKASIIKNNGSVIDEVWRLLDDLMRQETDMAEKMIAMEADSDTNGAAVLCGLPNLSKLTSEHITSKIGPITIYDEQV